MPAASGRVLREYARFSFRAWRESRYATELCADADVVSFAAEFGAGPHQHGARLLGSGCEGKLAQSFHGPRRAICKNTNY